MIHLYFRIKKHYCFLCGKRKICSYKEEYKNCVARKCPTYKRGMRND